MTNETQEPSSRPPGHRRIEVLTTDGAAEREVSVSDAGCEIGRAGADLACPEDLEMAPRHARIEIDEADRAWLVDSRAGSGVWFRIRGADGVVLAAGDQLWLGSQVLVVALDGASDRPSWQLSHHGPDGTLQAVHRVPESGFFIGRASELPLDPTDARLSRRHAQIRPDGLALRFYDRGAHNGSFLRVRGPRALSNGDEFRIATHRFRFVETPPQRDSVAPTQSPPTAGLEEARTVVFSPAEGQPPAGVERNRDLGALKAEENAGPGLASRLLRIRREDPAPTPSDDEDAAQSAREDAGQGGERSDEPESPQPVDSETPSAREDDGEERVLVVIDSDAGSIDLRARPGATIVEAFREAGFERGQPVDWECEDGGCGVCVLGVVEGADRLDPPDPRSVEMKTIQITEQVAPDPRRYRLACLARVRGTVRLRRLS